ncbi:MAG: TolB family protein, partial [Methylophilaceae bacterium]
MVWNEYRFDPRWRVRNYSAIVGYDVETKTKRVIAKRGRYAAAAISPDGYKIATVETTQEYQTKLVVLDYFSGQVLIEFANPNNDFISMPRWSADNVSLIALKTNQQGKAISQFNTQTGGVAELTDFSDENYGYPVPHGKYILYNSPASGIDNIYALDTETKVRYQVTCSKYGAYNPAVSPDGKTLYYNDQSADGMDVVKTTFDPSGWRIWTTRPQPSYTFAHLVEQEGNPTLLSNIPQETYKTKRYSRLKGIINPYRWGGYFNNNLTAVNVGLTSRDLLSTTTVNAGYNFDLNERTGTWKATVSYQGIYPIIDVSVSKSSRTVNKGSVETVIGNITTINGKNDTTFSVLPERKILFDWEETNFEAGLRLPLMTTSSKFISSIVFGNTIGATGVTNFRNAFKNSRYIPALIYVKAKDSLVDKVFPFIDYLS